jgi:hypothetical protein
MMQIQDPTLQSADYPICPSKPQLDGLIVHFLIREVGAMRMAWLLRDRMNIRVKGKNSTIDTIIKK